MIEVRGGFRGEEGYEHDSEGLSVVKGQHGGVVDAHTVPGLYAHLGIEPLASGRPVQVLQLDAAVHVELSLN